MFSSSQFFIHNAMPERPDLTIFAGNLKKHLVGQTLTGAEIIFEGNPSPTEDFEENVVGCVLNDVSVSGKEMLFHFRNDDLEQDETFSVHLMLKGGTIVLPTSNARADTKNVIGQFDFSSTASLVIYDPMKKAHIRYNPLADTVPDALTGNYDAAYITEQIKISGKRAIKTFLMDQEVLKGIGNAYADELFYVCKVDPESRCLALPEEILSEIVNQIKPVLQWGVEEIRKAVPEATSGEERGFMRVHTKTQTPLGETVLTKDVAGKKTYFAASQVLYT
jgi:formamidopyrimidine-DNA glycosylase